LKLQEQTFLDVEELDIDLPDGSTLIEELSLSVKSGEVVVVLGGSGSGKSTFLRTLLDREALEREGFRVKAGRLQFERDELGLVPQKGALFDYLDVKGNLELALRHRTKGTDGSSAGPEEWLERLDLPKSLGSRTTPVASLSGGQAQRVAVARALAGGRRLLCFDEPTTGLDPNRVRMLARVIRTQCDKLGVSALVVTHNVAFAAGVADRLFVLGAKSSKLEPFLAEDWPGPMEREGVDAAERRKWLIRLDEELVEKLGRTEDADEEGTKGSGTRAPPSAPRRALRAVVDFIASLGLIVVALRYGPGQILGRPRDAAPVIGRVIRQALLRPLAFYGVVSTLLGYTVLYVISQIGGAGVRPDAMVREIGGSYIVALAPAFSAMLFVAASGGATNAWIGNMVLTKQVSALQALGIDVRPYLIVPTWIVLMAAYLAVAAVFVVGMIAGGTALTMVLGMDDGFQLLTGDLLDPLPERVKYDIRALVLVWIYAWGIASDVVTRGSRTKNSSDDVTRAMTGSVVACTLWLVAWEMITVFVVYKL
jgi:ABC-type nitrate/sulfonate/bicarbonate transport system ATPase subunit/ABC-type transporter Mla maintaining outer membrane lipid asymmetry permease subunit MlaE